MKKWFLYLLLFSGILFITGAYIYRQNQYEKFEELFMKSKLYGSKKIAIVTTFSKYNKKSGLNLKSYKYSYFLKNDTFSREFYITTTFNKEFKIVGGGGSGRDFFNTPIFGINNKIYIYNIPEKSISSLKSSHYVIVEYEKGRQIRYYFEINEKVENKKYTIYFKSYPPKRILNAKNQYIKN